MGEKLRERQEGERGGGKAGEAFSRQSTVGLVIGKHHHHHHSIFNEKLTKRNNVQYEGKNKFKKISLCKLIHVFEQLSSSEVSGVRLNSQRTVVTVRSQFI